VLLSDDLWSLESYMLFFFFFLCLLAFFFSAVLDGEASKTGEERTRNSRVVL